MLQYQVLRFTAECSGLNGTYLSWPPKEDGKTVWVGRTGRSAKKCCLLDKIELSNSWTHWNYGYLHKIKPTLSFNIPASSTNWTQRTVGGGGRDIKVGGRHQGYQESRRGELGVDTIEIYCTHLWNYEKNFLKSLKNSTLHSTHQNMIQKIMTILE